MSPAAPTNPTLDANRAALEELRDLGMDMAGLTVARATADRTPASERVNRGVRRAVFLHQHIAAQCADAGRTERDQVRARAQIIRDVEDATVRRPKSEQDAFAAELAERLDAALPDAPQAALETILRHEAERRQPN